MGQPIYNLGGAPPCRSTQNEFAMPNHGWTGCRSFSSISGRSPMRCIRYRLWCEIHGHLAAWGVCSCPLQCVKGATRGITYPGPSLFELGMVAFWWKQQALHFFANRCLHMQGLLIYGVLTHLWWWSEQHVNGWPYFGAYPVWVAKNHSVFPSPFPNHLTPSQVKRQHPAISNVSARRWIGGLSEGWKHHVCPRSPSHSFSVC